MVVSSCPSSARIWWRWLFIQAGSSDGGTMRKATCTSSAYVLTNARCWVCERCGCASVANAIATCSFASAGVMATGAGDGKN